MIDDLDPRDAAVARLLAETPVNTDPQDLDRALTAYRNSRAVRGPRLPRHALRVGTVGLVTVVTGSLAAGYAAALPDPVQRVAHHLLARVGVPAPSHNSTQHPDTHVRPTPTATGVPAQHRTSRQHDVRRTTIERGFHVHLSIDRPEIAGSHAVAHVRVLDPGANSGPPVAVRLQWAPARNGPWQPLQADGVTNGDRTSISMPVFTVDTWVRATYGSATSRARLLTVIPTLAATWSRTPDGHLQLRVAATGGSPGDAILVVDTPQHGPATVIRVALDSHAHAVFTFETAPSGGDVLVVGLPATSRHGTAHVALRAPRGR